MKPNFLFAFANDSYGTLDLATEWENVYNGIIEEAKKNGDVDFTALPYSKKEEFANKLSEPGKRFSIIHYSGHSSRKNIFLEDGPLSSWALSALLQQSLPELQLVFLNGCINRAQVNHLFDKGIPAVIATSEKVSDKEAIKVSTRFYKTLINNNTLKTSFNLAAALLNNDYGEDENIYIGSNYVNQEDDPKAIVPWGLYVRDKDVLDWRLNVCDVPEFVIGIIKVRMEELRELYQERSYAISRVGLIGPLMRTRQRLNETLEPHVDYIHYCMPDLKKELNLYDPKNPIIKRLKG